MGAASFITKPKLESLAILFFNIHFTDANVWLLFICAASPTEAAAEAKQSENSVRSEFAQLLAARLCTVIVHPHTYSYI